MTHEEALYEVQSKSSAQIEEETARKWVARANACFDLFKQTSKVSWLLRAQEYRHEAIEHAALAGIDVLIALDAQLYR